MAQTGYTPIQIYSSSTGGNTPAAGSLTNSTLGSELAINITDGKLFYKDNANAVQVIGWKTTPTTAGGTGLTSYTAGDLLYYASGTTLSKLAIGTSGQWLGSSGTAPQWNSPAALTKTDDTNVTLTLGGSASTALLNAASLTLGWTGQLAASRGGTGIGTYTAGDLLYASGTTTLSKLAIGTANYVLTSSGSAPQWTAGSSVSVGTASNLLSNATSGVMQIVGPAASTTRVMTIPNANFTAARTDAAQTFTGTQVFSSLPQITAATANRILYADGSQVMATSTYMQFDGTKVQFGQGTFSVGDNDVGLTVTSGQRTNFKIVSTETGGTTWQFQTAGTGNYGSGAPDMFISGAAAGSIWFKTDGTNNTFKIGRDGNITFLTQNLVQGTAAKGINFTANTAAAGMTSQLLNWYEEGTWTPSISSSAGSITAYTSSGTYTRIGRMVYLQCTLDISNNGTGSGYIKVTGFPFTLSLNLLMVARDNSLTNKMIAGTYFNSTTMDINFSDGTYCGASGAVIRLNGNHSI